MEEKPGPSPNRRRLVLLTWILVAAFYFSLTYDYIRITSTDGKLLEYLEYVVQLAGTERRPTKEVRALILNKATELQLPIAEEQITVSGIGPTLNVFVDYEADINFPGLQRSMYRKIFQHTVKYRPPR